MKTLCLLIVSLATTWVQAVDYMDHFNFKTMRVDYYHFGKAGEEHFALDRIVDDGPWPGPQKNLIDTLAYGKYMVEIYAADGETLLFSRGFASIYGEWETTAAAQQDWGVYHESVRLPMPKHPVKLVLKKRGDDQTFATVWQRDIDPNGPEVLKAEIQDKPHSQSILLNGQPADKVDVVILGDGFSDRDEFYADAARMVDALFAKQPFKSRKSDFNIWAVHTPAKANGITRPQAGVSRRTPLGAQYGIFGSQRYMLSTDNRIVRDVAATVPYEYMVILANNRTYGGGGIYRLQATTSTKNAFSDYVFVHEFGHHFAGLGDEYYTSSVAYNTDDLVEPWEANITANPKRDQLKWADLVAADTPLPTDWQKKKFEKHSRQIQERRKQLREAQAGEEQLEALFQAQQTEEQAMLAAEKYAGKVGAFEGAGYRGKGYYRPQVDCVMFTRNPVDFCAVCSRAIEAVIDFHVGR